MGDVVHVDFSDNQQEGLARASERFQLAASQTEFDLSTEEGRIDEGERLFHQWTAYQRDLRQAFINKDQAAAAMALQNIDNMMSQYPAIFRQNDQLYSQDQVTSRLHDYHHIMKVPSISHGDSMDSINEFRRRVQAAIDDPNATEFIIDMSGDPGGDENGGFELADEMVWARELLEASGKKLVTFTNGPASSLKGYMMTIGHERIGTERSKIMIHQAQITFSRDKNVQSSEIADMGADFVEGTKEYIRRIAVELTRNVAQADRQKALEDKIKYLEDGILTRHGPGEGKYVDWVMDPQMALEEGFLTEITSEGAFYWLNRPIRRSQDGMGVRRDLVSAPALKRA